MTRSLNDPDRVDPVFNDATVSLKPACGASPPSNDNQQDYLSLCTTDIRAVMSTLLANPKGSRSLAMRFPSREFDG
jgi:hypothetical protein